MKLFCIWIALLTAGGVAPAHAQTNKLDLDKLQQKYLGDVSNEVQIVQNRKYTKAGKFEIGVIAGWINADPFLTVIPYGGYLGYHLDEMWGIRALYWKDTSSFSANYYGVQTQSGLTVNTNAPTSLLGGELQFTPIYGKVSFISSSIIYYDLSLFAGAGQRTTQSGNAITPILGVGQQFFFNKWLAVGFDYRLMHYSESIIDGQPASSTFGKVTGSRNDWTYALLFNVSCFL